MSASFAYSATFLSAVCFGLASVLEQLATRRTKTLNSINPLNYIPLLKQPAYLAGLLLDGLGFIMFLVAVRALPLFFVQAAETASIAVTALAGRFILHTRLISKEYKLMAGLIVGLSLLAYSAAPQTNVAVSNNFRYSVLYVALGLSMICLALSKKINRLPLLTGFLAGLCFSGLAITSRILPVSLNPHVLLTSPLSYALVIYGVLGMLLFSMALQAGSVTHVYATNFVTETIIPTIIGISFLGDAPRHGLWLVMLAGLTISVISTSALALAKSSTPESHA